jgi:hypothetical protein
MRLAAEHIPRSFSNALTIFLSPGPKGLKTDKKWSWLEDA